MRAHVQWTPELDMRLQGLREAGLTWDGIAAEMGLGTQHGAGTWAQDRRAPVAAAACAGGRRVA